MVIELKMGTFEPEYVSKMNFYLNVVDEQLRVGDDRESVGIILCTGHNETVAKVALHRVGSPIAVSTWQTSEPHQLTARSKPDPDPSELAELDRVRTRLVERVSRRANEIARGDSGREG